MSLKDDVRWWVAAKRGKDVGPRPHIHDWYQVAASGFDWPEFRCEGCNSQQFRLGDILPGEQTRARFTVRRVED